MGFSFKRFFQGINLVPKSVSSSNSLGDLEVSSSTGRISFHNGAVNSAIVTVDSPDILTDKTINTDQNTVLINGNLVTASPGSATLTFPNSTTTMVGNDTSNVLTNKTINGASNTITNVSLTSGVTGVLPLANGGTNSNLTPDAGAVVYSDGSSLKISSVGTSGQVLRSNGASPPDWFNAPGTGTVTSVTFTGDGTVLSNTPSSAVTSSGTLSASLNSQSANTVLAGPTTGAAAPPTFRALGDADGAIPIGTVLDFAGSSAPANYLVCDGSSLLRAGTYAALFAVIGTTYGAADGFHFNLPNLGGRATVGVGNSGGSTFNLGNTGGAETVTLNSSQMPVHSHGVTDPGHTHGLWGNAALTGALGANGLGNPYGTLPGLSVAGQNYVNSGSGNPGNIVQSVTTGITTTNSAGSGLSHNNLQPYTTLNKIIRFQ